jgi:stalled ribosome rescue protein Dom34
MANQVGVWIDHREAIVVKVTDQGTDTVRIDSEFESQPRRSSDHTSGKFESLQVPSDDTRERRKNADLNHFYDEVIAHFDHAKSLYIIGPGEARTELRKRLESKHPTAEKCVIEATDKMTTPQIVARVAAHFKS